MSTYRFTKAVKIGRFVTTNRVGSRRYSGCSLTIAISLASTYDAPQALSDTVTKEGGWWKTRCNMSGSSSDLSTEMSTWAGGAPRKLSPSDHPVATEETLT